MKFKAAVIGCLIATLLIGATTAVLLVQEAKKQTEISLKTAELISLQADMIAYQTISQVDTAAQKAYSSPNPNEKSLSTYLRGELAAQISGKIQDIRESLGLEEIQHPVYFFDEELRIQKQNGN